MNVWMSERKSEFSAAQTHTCILCMCVCMHACVGKQLGGGPEVQWLSGWQDIILFTAGTRLTLPGILIMH